METILDNVGEPLDFSPLADDDDGWTEEGSGYGVHALEDVEASQVERSADMRGQQVGSV